MITTTKTDTPYYTSEHLKPITNGFILYCTSDDTTSQWKDLSTLNYIVNSTNTTRESTDQLSMFGKSVKFNGISNYANIVTTYPIIGDKAQWSLSILYKSTTTIGNSSLYMEGCTTNRIPSLGIKLNYVSASNISYPGSVRFKYTDNTGIDGSLTGINLGSNDGKWHEITAVQSNKNHRELFFDGVSVATNTTTTVSMSLLNTSTMGALMRAVLEDYAACNISRIMIYNRSLLLSEIQHNYIHSVPYYMKNSIL